MTASPLTNSEQQRQRRRDYRHGFAAFLICGILATIGNAVFGRSAVPPFLRESLAPSVAIGLAAGYVVILMLVGWFGRNLLDEHEISCSAFGQSAATGIVIVGYPIWYLLWKGGLTPEPSHVTMFATLLLVSWAGYAYKKYL